MNQLAQLNPSYIPARFAGQNELLILRERMLQATLVIFALLGLPSVIIASWNYLESERFVFPAIYAGVYSIILLMLFFRNAAYQLRGYTMVSAAYVLALSELLESGQRSDMVMFLIACVMLAAILFGSRTVIAASALGLVTIATTGMLAMGSLTPGSGATAQFLGATWINSSLVFLLIVTSISASIRMIISGLETNLAHQAKQARSLEQQRSELERHIQDRTESIARRVTQLRTAADISRTISALSNPEELLQRVADIVRERFDLYYVGVFLLDQRREFAVLKAGTGDAGRQMVAKGHQLLLQGSSMVGWAITHRLPRVALDVGAEQVRFNNPLLPLTRSELALPIIAHDQVLGALTIQSDMPEAFDEDDIALLQSIADSLGVAQENDRLYNEARRGLEEIRSLNREYLQRAWSETAEDYAELAYAYQNQALAGSERAATTFQVPLVIRGETIGILDLEIERETLSEEESSFIENVTTQTAIALENARLLHASERRAIQEGKLNELASRFSRAMSIEEILRAAVVEFGQLPAVSEVSIQLRPVERQKLEETNRTAGGNGKEQAV